MHKSGFAWLFAAAIAVPSAGAAAPGEVVSRQVLHTHGLVGLSDLSFDPHGQLWAVAERQRALLAINVDATVHPGGAPEQLAIEGVPDAYDTEAIAWLDSDVVAIGTETQVPKRQSDDIFLARRQGGKVVVFDRLRMPYALWRMRAQSNRGIEGICAAGGLLVAASETVVRLPDGRRAAPLGRVQLSHRAWTPFWLPLTTQTGYVSALACRPAPGGATLEVWAIERHFGVARLLRAELPMAGEPQILRSQMWSDLAAGVAGELPNFEGIAQAAPGAPVFLITDNHYGRVTGPTWLFEVRPPAP